GTFALDTSNIDTGNGGAVGWSFTVNNAALQFLAAGQTLTQKYDVTVDNCQGGTATHTAPITITCTNDAPEITTADTSGSVTEDGPNTASGTVNYSNVATTAAHTALSLHDALPILGTFALDTSNIDTGNGGAVGWSFTVNNAALQFLAAGQTLTQKYDVTVD